MPGTDHHPLVIVGAGPAGLAAAYEAVRRGMPPIVLEMDDKVGGLARTEDYDGYRFDIGGHRFFTKVPEVQRIWQEMLGEEFLLVPRLSRIYYRGRFFDYPLNLFNTLRNLGPVESLLILLSYLQAKVQRSGEEKTFEQWVTNRFGNRLYEMFFRTYTEKVWGIPCSELQADWAAQRIQGLSLRRVVTHAVFRGQAAKSLIREFHYPVLGPGMMWQRMQQAVEGQGGQVYLESEVLRLERDGGRITSVVFRQGDGEQRIAADQIISSMPLGELITRLDPPSPLDVVEAARGLRYRDFVVVALVVKQATRFPDNWIYVHSPEVQVGRIQNFRNWSAAMVPDPQKSSLGLEYFCTEGDALWQMPDADLLALAARELSQLGLGREHDVIAGMVVRQPKAYPIYDGAYGQHVAAIRDFLESLDNLQTIGRNGMHRYNNMDHSMVTGMLAVRNLFGQNHDLWSVNVEEAYHEELSVPGHVEE
jgi:protoporphyrinogen oxidase